MRSTARPLTVLVLHGLGDLTGVRQTMIDYVTCFERHAPAHRFVYHDLRGAVPAALRRARFDAIVLDSTFLDARVIRPLELYRRIRDRFDFVRTSDAIKIALPQDEFDNGLVLDDWLADWEVDVVYACVGVAHHDVVFPRTRAVADLRHALTGYFEPTRLAALDRYPPLAARPIDVGYRVARLDPEFGRYGLIKAALCDAFEARLAGGPLVHDLSTAADRRIVGGAWLDFLGRCKHTLGAEGGSSVWDPRGEIRARIAVHRARRPGATRAELEAACFPGVDGAHVFRVMSPRVFEAAATRTPQVLIAADYAGLIAPWDHYLPVREDLTDVGDAIAAMADLPAAARRAAACLDALMASPRAHYATFARDVVDTIAERAEARRLPGVTEAEVADLRATLARTPWSARATRALARLRLGRFLPAPVKARLRARLGHRLGL